MTEDDGAPEPTRRDPDEPADDRLRNALDALLKLLQHFRLVGQRLGAHLGRRAPEDERRVLLDRAPEPFHFQRIRQ